MRIKNTSDRLSVQAIGGSHVVLLGWDFPRENCNGLLGFAIHRTDPTEEEAGWLRGLKTFEETDPGFVAGSTYSTREHPVQSFMWADYSAKPGRLYGYRVLALKGSPTALEPVAQTADRESGGRAERCPLQPRRRRKPGIRAPLRQPETGRDRAARLRMALARPVRGDDGIRGLLRAGRCAPDLRLRVSLCPVPRGAQGGSRQRRRLEGDL
jgi:hypothetical protein